MRRTGFSATPFVDQEYKYQVTKETVEKKMRSLTCGEYVIVNSLNRALIDLGQSTSRVYTCSVTRAAGLSAARTIRPNVKFYGLRNRIFHCMSFVCRGGH